MKSFPKWFIRLTQVTLVVIFLVIVAGGVVRMTGSGMGCPDWPKCFEQYIPPTSVDQLPENYKDIYAEKRKKKLERFIGLIDGLGLDETAEQLRNDRTILVEQDFNPYNTWTEYVNRLVGALSGLFVLAMTLASVFFWRRNKWLVILSLVQLIILVFQAWMGAMTVATNLTPWVLTIHMLLAILIVTIQIKIIRLAHGPGVRVIRMPAIQLKALLYFAIAISIVQIVAGTGVRQGVDVMEDLFAREKIVENMGGEFIFHRSFAWLVLIVNGLIVYLNFSKNIRLKWVNALAVVIGLEILSGIGLAYFGLPAVLQPVHLTLSVILIAIQIHLTQVIKWGKK